jgi:hypothetical protein
MLLNDAQRWQASYSRFLKDRVTVTSIAGPKSGRAAKTVTNIAARVMAYQPQEIVGTTVIQGDTKVILLKSDLVVKGYPVPPVKGDQIVVNGKTLTAQAVDQNTRKSGTEIIAYEVQARGA